MAALLVGSFSAHAAGLGKLTVFSAIGQPLNAEVAVTATQEELNSLSARIASHDAFKDAGIEFMPALTGLRFSVVKSASGQPMLRLTTDAPLNEPFLHFLVELNWTSGRMVREYTFLLDPPEMLKVTKPAGAVTPAVTEPVVAKSVTKPVAPPSTPVRVQLAPPAAAPAVREFAASEVRVNQGDTLSKIARENLPVTITLDQMLVALFNKNRDAFEGDNMNRLRAGKILRVPDTGEAGKVTPTEARKVVLTQGTDFNAYRRRLAEAAGSATPSDTTAGQHVAGKIKSQVEEKATLAPQADKLEVSRTETGKAPKVDGKNDVAAKSRLEEELVARDKSLREASERIAQLEKNLENLKKLVELKSQDGAKLQQQAQAATPVSPPPAVVKTDPTPTKPAPAPVSPQTPPTPAQPPAAVSPVSAPETKAAEPVAVKAEPVPAPVQAPKPAVKKPAPPPPPEPEPSFIEDNLELVLGGGGILALLLGYLGFSSWRKKKQAKDQSPDFPETPSAMVEPALAPVAAAPAVLADDVSILGDFSESGALTSEENVDPVAEADVLMAYGRDGQAEEILLEGLKNDPERSAIHIKLLELYANRNDAGRFEAVAKDVRKLSGEAGPDWVKVLALAAGIGVSLAEDTVAPAAPVAPAPQVAEVIAEEIDLPAAMEGDDSSKTMILSASPLVEMPAPEPAAGDSLDFDLDLGSTSGPALAAAELAASAQPAGEEVMSLDFDFGTPETSGAADIPAEAPAVAAEVEAAAPAQADDSAIDFSFNLDAPVAVEVTSKAVEETPALVLDETPALVVAPSDAMDMDIDLGEPELADVSAPLQSAPAGGALADLKLDFDLDLDAGVPATEAEPPVHAIDLSFDEAAFEATEFSVASGDLDMDLSMDTDLPMPEVSDHLVEAQEVAAGGVGEIELPDLELTAQAMDISLDEAVLPDSMDAASVEPVGLWDVKNSQDVAVAVADADADAVRVPDDPEVATKLELAQAYQEMGDREGARELLNEVLTEGSAAQQAAARTRLEQLDA